MSLTISKAKLKPKLLNYLRKVEIQRIPITVTDHGHPVVQIIPFREKKQDPFRKLAGSVLQYDDPLDPVGENEWDLKL